MNLFRALASALVLVAATPVSAQTVLRDDFSNRASGWPHAEATRDSDGGFSIYTDSGQYQLTPVKDNTFGLVPAPRQARGDNVRIETDMFMYAGLGAGIGGVACRVQDMQNFYGFVARADAVLMIVKVENGTPTPLAQGRVKTVMPGSVDTRFTVECRGDRLSLSASGGGRIEATDSALRGGRTALLVAGEQMAGTSAVFDDFVLEDLGGYRGFIPDGSDDPQGLALQAPGAGGETEYHDLTAGGGLYGTPTFPAADANVFNVMGRRPQFVDLGYGADQDNYTTPTGGDDSNVATVNVLTLSNYLFQSVPPPTVPSSSNGPAMSTISTSTSRWRRFQAPATSTSSHA